MMLLSNAIVVNGLVHLLAESALYFAGYDLEAIGIQEVAEIAFFCRGVLYGEEAVVKACLCIDSGLTFYPIDGCFGLSITTFRTGLGGKIHGGMYGSDASVSILLTAGSLDDISVLLAHFATHWAEAEEVLITLLLKVCTFYPKLVGKRHLARAQFLMTIDIRSDNRFFTLKIV